MSDQQDNNETQIPSWVVNQIGRMSIEIEYLKAENSALRSALATVQEKESESSS